MNRVWMSGKVMDTSLAANGERIFILATLDIKPRLILAKYRGKATASVGDIIESAGELSEQEPVTVNGHVVTGPDGRVAMRNVYRITELTNLIPQAKPLVLNRSNEMPFEKVANPTHQSSTTKESKVDYNGPELPWT